MVGVERKQFDDVLRTNEKGKPVKNTSPSIYTAAEIAAIRHDGSEG